MYYLPTQQTKRTKHMSQYAILFDLDTNCLTECNPDTTYYGVYNKEVRDFLMDRGFKWTQGSVYFGDETITAVKCVLVVQELGKQFPWFTACVKDLRMLRVEENNDLLPALK